jgi:hypothetical protein
VLLSREIVVDPRPFFSPPILFGREWSSHPRTLYCCINTGRIALIWYISINLLAKLIEKLICKWNSTKLTMQSCVPSPLNASNVVTDGLKRQGPHASILLLHHRLELRLETAGEEQIANRL